MKVAELIEELQNYDNDMEVKIGIQPNYPLGFRIQHFVAEDQESNTLYILQSAYDGGEYLSRDLW
jgi:hypothetical protein